MCWPGAVLGHVLELVEEREDASPDTVVATHPANWGPYKLELFEQAVRQSTDGDVTLLSEPEAAARYYSSLERVEVGDVVAVYDLGGGTFDAAVLERTEDGYRLVGEPSGIERLGGIDFDRALYRHVLGQVDGNLADADQVDGFGIGPGYQRLRADCVRAKELLSTDVTATLPVLLPGVDTVVRVTRKELEALLRPALAPTVEMMGDAITAAGLVPSELHRILLVGGSSRIPLIGEMLSESLGVPVGVDLHPKLATVLGAVQTSVPPQRHRLAGAEPTTPAVGAPDRPVDFDRTVPIDPRWSRPGAPGPAHRTPSSPVQPLPPPHPSLPAPQPIDQPAPPPAAPFAAGPPGHASDPGQEGMGSYVEQPPRGIVPLPVGVQHGRSAGQPTPTYGQPAAAPPPVRTYLLGSILTTIFCCLPTGIVAIVFASQARGLAGAGDVPGALRKARRARLWVWISVVIGLVFWIASAINAANQGTTT